VLPVTIAKSSESTLQVTAPGGARLSVSRTASIAEGKPAHIMVRPESLKVLEAGDQAETILEGTVMGLIMLAGVSRGLLRLASGEMVPSKSLTLAAGPRVDRGRRVRLGWSAADTVLLTRATTRNAP